MRARDLSDVIQTRVAHPLQQLVKLMSKRFIECNKHNLSVKEERELASLGNSVKRLEADDPELVVLHLRFS